MFNTDIIIERVTKQIKYSQDEKEGHCCICQNPVTKHSKEKNIICYEKFAEHLTKLITSEKNIICYKNFDEIFSIGNFSNYRRGIVN